VRGGLCVNSASAVTTSSISQQHQA